MADQPRAIVDRHPPRVVNPAEKVGPRIASLYADGWRIVEWDLQCVDDACTEVECRPLGYVSGDWSDDGMVFFVETLVGPVAATASEIAAAKKACYESTITGCCGGFTPGLPPCANYCWYAFEAVCGTGGSCYYNCAGTCKSDWGGTCPPPPSWGNPLGWDFDWQA